MVDLSRCRPAARPWFVSNPARLVRDRAVGFFCWHTIALTAEAFGAHLDDAAVADPQNLCCTKRQVKDAAASGRTAVGDRDFDALLSLDIGHPNTCAEWQRSMRRGQPVGIERQSARGLTAAIGIERCSADKKRLAWPGMACRGAGVPLRRTLDAVGRTRRRRRWRRTWLGVSFGDGRPSLFECLRRSPIRY
jgi:hypothetical protein